MDMAQRNAEIRRQLLDLSRGFIFDPEEDDLIRNILRPQAAAAAGFDPCVSPTFFSHNIDNPPYQLEEEFHQDRIKTDSIYILISGRILAQHQDAKWVPHPRNEVPITDIVGLMGWRKTFVYKRLCDNRSLGWRMRVYRANPDHGPPGMRDPMRNTPWRLVRIFRPRRSFRVPALAARPRRAPAGPEYY